MRPDLPGFPIQKRISINLFLPNSKSRITCDWGLKVVLDCNLDPTSIILLAAPTLIRRNTEKVTVGPDSTPLTFPQPSVLHPTQPTWLSCCA